MSHPDGWVEGDGDLPFLPKQDGFDGVRRFFDDLLGPGATFQIPLFTSGYAPGDPAHHVICCVCLGEGRYTILVMGDLGPTGGSINMTCLACDGSGSVGMVRERKGTR